MKILYVSDQVLPQTATDTTQIMSMVGGFSQNGAEIELILPLPWRKAGATVEELSQYYQIAPDFKVTYRKSCYPFIRGIEKVGHGVTAALTQRDIQADIVYTRNIPVLVSALQLGELPVVYETYRPWPEQRRYMGGLFRRLNRQPLFLGTVLHSALAAESYKAAGVDPTKILTVHNGFDPKLFTPQYPRQEARKQCGLPADRTTVVYGGHISPEKGLDMVLDFAEVLQDVQFVLVGSTRQGQIESRAAKLSNVMIEGWKSLKETIPYFFAADVLIIPPTSKPLTKVGNTVLPIKTFMYMAAGRAIFAPDNPDLREVLVHRQNAVLVPPDDHKAGLTALQGLVADKGLMERLGNRAYEGSLGNTWQNRAKRILGFIEQRLRCTIPS